MAGSRVFWVRTVSVLCVWVTWESFCKTALSCAVPLQKSGGSVRSASARNYSLQEGTASYHCTAH